MSTGEAHEATTGEPQVSHKPGRATPDVYDPRAGRLSRILLLWRHMRRLARDGHLSPWHQLWEITRLRRSNGVTVAHYLETGLYRRELTWQQKCTFVGPLRYTKLLIAITPRRYRYIVRNKLVTHSLFMTFGIPTPRFYGVVAPSDTALADPLLLRSPAELLALLNRVQTDRVCFKLIDGLRGVGFYKVTIDSRDGIPIARTEPDGREMPLDEFWGTCLRPGNFLGYFCQEVVEPHPFFARFNPSSLNTFRTWMARDENGDWDMVLAILRIGLGDSAVDNVMQMGIAVRVDVASGRLSVGLQKTIERVSHTHHPTTNVRIQGETVPMWDDIKALCHDVATRFPFFDFLAVDVAVGANGPLVMELSVTPDDLQGVSDVGVGPLLEPLAARPRRR